MKIVSGIARFLRSEESELFSFDIYMINGEEVAFPKETLADLPEEGRTVKVICQKYARAPKLRVALWNYCLPQGWI